MASVHRISFIRQRGKFIIIMNKTEKTVTLVVKASKDDPFQLESFEPGVTKKVYLGKSESAKLSLYTEGPNRSFILHPFDDGSKERILKIGYSFTIYARHFTNRIPCDSIEGVKAMEVTEYLRNRKNNQTPEKVGDNSKLKTSNSSPVK